MQYLITIFISAVALIIDFSIYSPYHAPKNFALIVLVAISLLVYWLYGIVKGKSHLTISVIEIILWVRLIWVVITNPGLLTHPSDLGFWILFSLTLLAFLTRQIMNPTFSVPSVESSTSTATNISRKCINFLRYIWLIGLIQAFYGFYQYYMSGYIKTSNFKTPMLGTIGTANGYGLFMAVSIIALIFEIKRQNSRRNRWLLLLCASFIFFALILNKSRGALLALVITGFLILLFILLFDKNNHLIRTKIMNYFRLNKVFKKTGQATAIILIVCFICVVGLGTFLYLLNLESSFGRLMIWDISARMFADNPIFGIGHGRYGFNYLDYQALYFRNPDHKQWAYKAGHLYQAHNEYFQAFCESGILGGLLFLSIWMIALWAFFNHLRYRHQIRWEHYGILSIFLLILVHALFDSPLHVITISAIEYILLGFIPINRFSCQLKIKSKAIQWFLLLLFIGYAGFCVHKIYNQYLGYKEWKNGHKYRMDKRPDLATEHFKKALAKLRDKGELEFNLGASMIMHNEYKEAVYFLEKSLETFKDRNLYVSLSWAYIQLKDYEKAEHYAKTILSMYPDQLTPHLYLGKIYFHQGKIALSKASLERCIHRKTHFKTNDVKRVARSAKNMWKELYWNIDPIVESIDTVQTNDK